MDNTRLRPVINSHTALLASLLEHAGHLSEWIMLEDVSFDSCCRYVFYSFSTSRDKELVNAIMESSSIHMKRLSMDDEPIVTDCFWIGTMDKEERILDMKDVESKWDTWRPSNKLEKMIKNTFDEMF